LIRGESPTVVEIDYSFNEINQQIDTIKLAEGGCIQVYSLPDLVGEKIPGHDPAKTRNRTRRQDAFDIYWLLKKGYLEDPAIRIHIYRSLLKKSESRRSQSPGTRWPIRRSKGVPAPNTPPWLMKSRAHFPLSKTSMSQSGPITKTCRGRRNNQVLIASGTLSKHVLQFRHHVKKGSGRMDSSSKRRWESPFRRRTPEPTDISEVSRSPNLPGPGTKFLTFLSFYVHATNWRWTVT
jgi:hypothetical protein